MYIKENTNLYTKKNEVMKHATTWMILNNITLHEKKKKNQYQKTTNWIITIMRNISNKQIHKERMVD